jgi:hypothetical protein
MANNSKDEEKLSYVTWEGRTIVNVNKLVKEPKVQAALDKIAQVRLRSGNQPGKVVFPPLTQKLD